MTATTFGFYISRIFAHQVSLLLFRSVQPAVPRMFALQAHWVSDRSCDHIKNSFVPANRGSCYMPCLGYVIFRMRTGRCIGIPWSSLSAFKLGRVLLTADAIVTSDVNC